VHTRGLLSVVIPQSVPGVDISRHPQQFSVASFVE
jgi:hypothetical protein